MGQKPAEVLPVLNSKSFRKYQPCLGPLCGMGLSQLEKGGGPLPLTLRLALQKGICVFETDC